MGTVGIPGTRERILAKALELFSLKGYAATSVREVCDAAGIAKPSLYHFFGSKEGLYRALVDESLDAYRRDLKETLSKPGSSRERLGRVARGYFRAAREQRDLMRFLFALIHARPTEAPATDFSQFRHTAVTVIEEVIDDGVRDGELAQGRADLRTLVFLGALGEALAGYVLFGEPELTSELADSITDIILEGWRPRCA
jgi:TetR/AcrR family transcriptional regulator